MRRDYKQSGDIWFFSGQGGKELSSQLAPSAGSDELVENLVTSGLSYFLFGERLPNTSEKELLAKTYAGAASRFVRRLPVVQEHPWLVSYWLAWAFGPMHRTFSRGLAHDVYVRPSKNEKERVGLSYCEEQGTRQEIFVPSRLYMFYADTHRPVMRDREKQIPWFEPVTVERAFEMAGVPLIPAPVSSGSKPLPRLSVEGPLPKKPSSYIQPSLF